MAQMINNEKSELSVKTMRDVVPLTIVILSSVVSCIDIINDCPAKKPPPDIQPAVLGGNRAR